LTLPMSAQLPEIIARPMSVTLNVWPASGPAMHASVKTGSPEMSRAGGLSAPASPTPMFSGALTEWLPELGVSWQVPQKPAMLCWFSTSLRPATPVMLIGTLLNTCSPRAIAPSEVGLAMWRPAPKKIGIGSHAASRLGTPFYSDPIITVPADQRPPAPPTPALAPRPERGGFANLGEQLRAVARAERGGIFDQRLQRAPTSAGEVDPTGGGFLVGENFAEALIGSIYEQAVLGPLCDRRPTAFPGREHLLPAIDESSRADGARWGGVTSYWAAVAANVSNAFPRFRNVSLGPHKIIVVVYGTGELAEDVSAFSAHLERALSSEFAIGVDNSILKGSGAGQPLGLINAPAAISVAKETGQASGTIVAENIENMWARLPALPQARGVDLQRGCRSPIREIQPRDCHRRRRAAALLARRRIRQG
jgi:hypothetical protein